MLGIDYLSGWSIAFAAGLVFLSVLRKAFTPPRELAHLPLVPVWSSFWITLTTRGFEEFYDLAAPILIAKGICLAWRYGQWNILLGRAEDVHRIFNESNDFPKLLLTERIPNTKVADFIGDNIIYSNGEDWKRHRKSVNKFFKKQWETRPIIEMTNILICEWEKICDKPISVHNWTERLTLDILGLVLFGLEFNGLSDGKGKVVTLYVQTVSFVYKFLYVAFPFLDKFRKKEIAVIDEYEAMIDNYIESRTAALKEGNINPEADALTAMISANNREENLLSKKELKNTFKMLFLAGHDTTATTLSGILYHLSINQEIQDKLRREIISSLGVNGPISPSEEIVKEMPYLTRVIRESLRLLPPVAIDIERENNSVVQFQGYTIPPHSNIQAHIWHLHREPLYWTNPESFNPERFNPENEKDWGKYWVPFITGTRQCKPFALKYI
ncbi:hypothetical protein DSO57_1022572 [Entomophthora muscae]|uniref:Uncharacterized protein n=1 Tax=Entomophthora muscae TaxID=34485 RepID=A0ACC2U106_9FUNG|nr:hypothetical protein DSO57_1022572 [Entomophthora muscae]